MKDRKDVNYCKSCIHCVTLYGKKGEGGELACMYVADECKMRPCKGGYGCTVRKIRRKRTAKGEKSERQV